MLAYFLSVFILLATVLSTFRTDQPHFELSPNSPWAISADKILGLHTNEMLQDFDIFKIEPEVVLVARWRPKEKMTSPFDSPTPILYRLSVEFVRLFLTVQKLFVCIDLAGNLAFRFQNLGFLTPKYSLESTRPSKGTSFTANHVV